MADITMTMESVRLHLDRVNKIEQKGRKRALMKAGAFVRRRARTRILRRRKRSSAPGQPPSIHARSKTESLKAIFFRFEPSTSSVVVGPVKLNGRQETTTGSQTLPSVLEFGGDIVLTQRRIGSGDWSTITSNAKKLPGEQRRKRRVRIKKRPFMSLALQREVESGTIPPVYRNVISE